MASATASATTSSPERVKTHQMFGKKDLTEVGLPWAKGGEKNPWKSKRNTKAGVFSPMLGKAIVVAMQGNIEQLIASPDSSAIQITSTSTTDGTERVSYYLEPERLLGETLEPVLATDPYDGYANYHHGLIFLGLAMARPEDAQDFLRSYLVLLKAWIGNGRKWAEILKDKLYNTTDELYFWMKLQSEPESSSVNWFDRYTLRNSAGSPLRVEPEDISIDPRVFTDPVALESLMKGKAPVTSAVPISSAPTASTGAAPASTPTPASRKPATGKVKKTPPDPFSPIVDSDPVEEKPADEFIGPQIDLLKEAIASNRNTLLIGPTGTGKTRAVEEAVFDLGVHMLVRINGMAGLQDLDFLGGFVPLSGQDGHVWKDGPLARAIRLATENPVVLFVDEITRIPQEQLNLLVGFLNPTDAATMRMEGIAVEGNGKYYKLEIPLTSETIWCPVQHLVVIGAGNLGMDYAVSQHFDPALRRRFRTMIEFQYLRGEQLKTLVKNRVPGLTGKVLETIVTVSDHILDMVRANSLRTAMDTASLLEWASKVKDSGASTLGELMDQAYLTWSDQVCGRNALGMVEIGTFHGIFDFERTKRDHLPEGKTNITPQRI